MATKWTNHPGVLYLEMEVNFLSSGYYDAGQTCGPPESCYPPEGEDERTLDTIKIGDKELPKELAEKLFEFLQADVDAVEMETPEYEPLEDDYM